MLMDMGRATAQLPKRKLLFISLKEKLPGNLNTVLLNQSCGKRWLGSVLAVLFLSRL